MGPGPPCTIGAACGSAWETAAAVGPGVRHLPCARPRSGHSCSCEHGGHRVLFQGAGLHSGPRAGPLPRTGIRTPLHGAEWANPWWLRTRGQGQQGLGQLPWPSTAGMALGPGSQGVPQEGPSPTEAAQLSALVHASCWANDQAPYRLGPFGDISPHPGALFQCHSFLLYPDRPSHTLLTCLCPTCRSLPHPLPPTRQPQQEAPPGQPV